MSLDLTMPCNQIITVNAFRLIIAAFALSSHYCAYSLLQA